MHYKIMRSIAFLILLIGIIIVESENLSPLTSSQPVYAT